MKRKLLFGFSCEHPRLLLSVIRKKKKKFSYLVPPAKFSPEKFVIHENTASPFFSKLALFKLKFSISTVKIIKNQ